MTKGLTRPQDLPDFNSPPLNEVVLGVQFAAPQGYQKIRAGEVWSLFRNEYPQVQELPALPPSFETFGLAHQYSPIPQITFSSGSGIYDRFWFLRPDGEELIQFQPDRLLHNWRKVGDGSNSYPRFESMIAEFEKELIKFQDYVTTLAHQSLSINQCEVSYINHIKYDRANETVSKWLRFVNFNQIPPDDFNIGFREVLRDDDGKPHGRLSCEAVLGLLPDGQEIISFTLSVRGAPSETNINAALNFLSDGRKKIVRRFAELTTDAAHQKWERVK